MRNDILDEVEKYTGPRTCPECGYQYPLWVFVRRYLMSFGLSKWPCYGCRQIIKCDFIKINFFWLLGLLPCGLLFSVSIYYLDLGWLNIIYLSPYFAFVLLTLYYAKFEVSE
jgi:hypothetical protein